MVNNVKMEYELLSQLKVVFDSLRGWRKVATGERDPKKIAKKESGCGLFSLSPSLSSLSRQVFSRINDK